MFFGGTSAPWSWSQTLSTSHSPEHCSGWGTMRTFTGENAFHAGCGTMTHVPVSALQPHQGLDRLFYSQTYCILAISLRISSVLWLEHPSPAFSFFPLILHLQDSVHVSSWSGLSTPHPFIPGHESVLLWYLDIVMFHPDHMGLYQLYYLPGFPHSSAHSSRQAAHPSHLYSLITWHDAQSVDADIN